MYGMCINIICIYIYMCRHVKSGDLETRDLEIDLDVDVDVFL